MRCHGWRPRIPTRTRGQITTDKSEARMIDHPELPPNCTQTTASPCRRASSSSEFLEATLVCAVAMLAAIAIMATCSVLETRSYNDCRASGAPVCRYTSVSPDGVDDFRQPR